MKLRRTWLFTLFTIVTLGNLAAAGSRVELAPEVAAYPDGGPIAKWRLEAQDQGIVLRHGNGPNNCDALGARDIWVWEHNGTY
jgi:hypothetical protein